MFLCVLSSAHTVVLISCPTCLPRTPAPGHSRSEIFVSREKKVSQEKKMTTTTSFPGTRPGFRVWQNTSRAVFAASARHLTNRPRQKKKTPRPTKIKDAWRKREAIAERRKPQKKKVIDLTAFTLATHELLTSGLQRSPSMLLTS